MTESDKDCSPPEPTVSDHVHAMSRAGISSIPVVGAAAAELFHILITPPLERRRSVWLQDIAERLKALESNGVVELDRLAEHESFVTTVMRATQSALRNHQQEKLEALRNAVLNSALPDSPDDSIQQMFVAMVDELTVWHLSLLYFFQDPVGWYSTNGQQPPQFGISSSLSRVLAPAFPELMSHGELWEKLLIDLYQKGLFSTENIHITMSADGAYQKHTTALGDQFIAFITAPEEAK